MEEIILDSKQRNYIETLLGKLLWLRSIERNLPGDTGDKLVSELVEILHTGTYNEFKKDWMNSLSDSYITLNEIEESVMEQLKIQYLIDYLGNKNKML